MGRHFMHPAARIRSVKSRRLEGRRIVLGVSGSIAAVEAVRLAHELIRHGADVIPVMTSAATRLITPLALEYATGHAPITHLSGRGEHVEWMDGPERADLLLVAPATANTLSKMALGIDDTALTSFATVALGSGVPILVAPAMHEVMNHNPVVQERLKQLQERGVRVVQPRFEEGKAKLASPEDVAEDCIHQLATGRWVGRNVLIISGSTAEPVDPVRVVTNRSSGQMGVALATAAYRAGAHVTLWNAWGRIPLPSFTDASRYETVDELAKLVKSKGVKGYDAIFMPAALSDFAPKPVSQKIRSDEEPPALQMKKLPKIIQAVRRKAPRALLVGFKAESDEAILVERARQRLGEYGADLVVANTARAFGADQTRVYLVKKSGKPKTIEGSKTMVAEGILQEAGRLLPK